MTYQKKKKPQKLEYEFSKDYPHTQAELTLRRLYMANKTDQEIAKTLLCNIREVITWRTKEKLPSNEQILKISKKFERASLNLYDPTIANQKEVLRKWLLKQNPANEEQSHLSVM